MKKMKKKFKNRCIENFWINRFKRMKVLIKESQRKFKNKKMILKRLKVIELKR